MIWQSLRGSLTTQLTCEGEFETFKIHEMEAHSIVD